MSAVVSASRLQASALNGSSSMSAAANVRQTSDDISNPDGTIRYNIINVETASEQHVLNDEHNPCCCDCRSASCGECSFGVGGGVGICCVSVAMICVIILIATGIM